MKAMELTKEELKSKVEKLRKECKGIQDEYLEAGKSWDEYRQNPKVREYWKALAEYRLVQDYKLHPISGDCGTHMTLEEFKGYAGTFFSDYDGSGYYATETEVSDVPCVPSEICDGYVRNDFTHVMWYNK